MKQLKRLSSLLLLIAILAFAGMSFAPCLTNGSYSFVKETGYAYTSGYASGFCCVVSVIELLLLLKSQKVGASVLGAVLNAVKAFAPLPVLNGFARLLPGGIMGETYYYSLTVWGYAILCLGGIITLLYIIDAAGKKHIEETEE